jgi:hypothetical protein
MSSRTADSKVLVLGIRIDSDADGLGPVLIRAPHLDARHPILLARFFVAVVPTNALALGSLQRTSAVIHGKAARTARAGVSFSAACALAIADNTIPIVKS